MRVVVTGAGGFVGRRFVRELADRGQLGGRPISEIVLVDRVPCEIESNPLVKTRSLAIDLTDRNARKAIFAAPVDAVFYLAATMTADAERDFDRGLSMNLGAFSEFLEDCRQNKVGRVVFSSSMAAFGGELPDIVPDEIAQRPQSSYGVQKVIAELLLDDYTRRGFFDGRALRLPVVLLRQPGGAPTISGAISAVICEPLAGRNVTCAFPGDAPMPVASVGAVSRALVKLFEMPSEALGVVRTINLPALTVTINDMIDALERQMGPKARAMISWQIDPAMTALMGGMPKGMTSSRAIVNGLIAEQNFDRVIADYLSREGTGR